MTPANVHDAMTLGQLIDVLQRVQPTAFVLYDWWGLKPTTLRSYRGYYEDLALGVDQGGSPTIARELLAECLTALGRTFRGYKGGDYRATRDTPLWASDWGQVSGIIITGAVIDDEESPSGWLHLMTKKIEG